jgi:hypothetical protein
MIFDNPIEILFNFAKLPSGAMDKLKAIGYCDASRLLVRPRSGMLALMVEYEDGAKEWYHITPRMLKPIRERLAWRAK